jgi:hypothetical protein
LLRSQTLAKLKPPLVIEKLEPSGLRAFYDAHGELRIISEAEWSLWDQAADDEEILILLAAYRLLKEDEPIIWDEPYT